MINENYLDYDCTVQNDEIQVKNFLIGLGFRKVGHIKPECCGFCIRLRDKTFFECSNFSNPQIQIVTDIATLKTKIQNYEEEKII